MMNALPTNACSNNKETEGHLGTCQASMIELFVKTDKEKQITIFTQYSIIDAWQGKHATKDIKRKYRIWADICPPGGPWTLNKAGVKILSQ